MLANLSDINTFVTAFQGAHAIFLNTDFWQVYWSFFTKATATGMLGEDELDPSEIAFRAEVSKGKSAVLAAAKAHTLENFVYTALPSMRI